MRLGLSSAAAPDAGLDELLAACARRGLTALELRDEDLHGVAGRKDGVGGADAARRAAAAGVVISGFRSGSGDADLRLARIAREAGAPVLVGGGETLGARIDRAAALAAVDSASAVVVDGVGGGEDIRSIAEGGFQVAWEARVDEGGLGGAAERILREAADRLCHVRLIGGGPETPLGEGRGVGELMASLALCGYRGTVILSPSSPRYRIAWQTWLGRRGGWGCGSKAGGEDAPMRISKVVGAGGGR